MLKSGCSNEPSFLGVNAGRLKLSWKVCAMSEEEVVKEEERGRWGVMYMQGHPQQKAQTTGSSTSSTQYVRLLAHIKILAFHHSSLGR